jgi:hypothetical protein
VRAPCIGVRTSLGLVVVCQAAPTGQRLDWEKLSTEQQLALKGNNVQGKEVSVLGQTHYFYKEGQRVVLHAKGDDAQTVFRLEGSGTELRHVGRGEIKLSAAKTPGELKSTLEALGLKLGTQMDASGFVWTVQTPPGLTGLKALNQLKESGFALSASPDWQRDLRKK